MPQQEERNPTVVAGAPTTLQAPSGYHFTTLDSGAQNLRPDSAQGPASNIPGDRQLWTIDGQLFLVWLVPVDNDGDGKFDESIPIGFLANANDLRNAGLSTTPVKTLTSAQWDKLGGLEMGFMSELNNPDKNPFDDLVDTMVFQSDLYPHLLDPGVMAATAAAWLMGRAVTEDDLLRTEWGQTHSAEERQWLVSAGRDPASAANVLREYRVLVSDEFQSLGVINASTELINLIADRWATGAWGDRYAREQIKLLADPYRTGDLDPLLEDFFSGDLGFQLDTTTSRLDTVKDTVQKWLGPTFGNWTDQQFNEWAGRIRQNPDAIQNLEALLSTQRLAMFPAYADPTLTYDDISGPWRGLFQQVWGQIPDETDPLFTSIVNLNDVAAASKVLYKEGLDRGIRTVTESALRDMYSSMGGTQVVRAI